MPINKSDGTVRVSVNNTVYSHRERLNLLIRMPINEKCRDIAELLVSFMRLASPLRAMTFEIQRFIM